MFSNKLQTNPSSRPRHRLPLTVALSATLAFASVPVAGLSQQTAWAEDIDTNVQADAAQQEVERTAAEYDQAISRIGDLNQQIADNEARIAEIEEALPTQQERSSAAAVKLYKTQASTPGLLEMVLSSENIVDFFTSLEYVSHIYSSNQAEIKRLSELKDELDQTKRGHSRQHRQGGAGEEGRRRRGSQRRAGAFRRPAGAPGGPAQSAGGSCPPGRRGRKGR